MSRLRRLDQVSPITILLLLLLLTTSTVLLTGLLMPSGLGRELVQGCVPVLGELLVLLLLTHSIRSRRSGKPTDRHRPHDRN